MPIIGIDYTPAYEQGGGIGRYVRELVRAAARQQSPDTYRLFVAGTRNQNLPPPVSPQFVWKPTRLNPTWLARLWHRSHIPVPVEFFVGKVDLFHATDFVLPPVTPYTRTLLTVHDLSFVRVPEAASPRLKRYLDTVVPHSVRRADHVLADSQATKDDLIALYDTPADKITVLLSGVDSAYVPIEDKALQQIVRRKYALGDTPYLFSVGTVQPRKNYSRLIQALARLRAQNYNVNLVIAGGKGWLEDPIYEVLRAERMHDFVHFIGFADDIDLPTLYSAAACTVLPSLYEGFGLPVLESFACGTPVITSNLSSLPEVAGDAGLLVNPTEVDEIVASVKKVLDDSVLRSTLISRGLARAQIFTWDHSAAHLLQVYQNLLTL